jgi:phospholipid-binding lipoprotein MlaA
MSLGMNRICIFSAAVLLSASVSRAAPLELADTIITSVVINASSFWVRTTADAPDQYSYKFTMESMVQTGGIRYFVYKDFIFHLGDTNATTNVVFYTPYTRDVKKPLTVEIGPPPVPTNVLSILDSLPDILPDVIPPFITGEEEPEITREEPERFEGMVEYVDYVDYSAVDMPDDNEPVLFDFIGINDPLESFNRIMFIVDDTIFVYLISPLGKVYRLIFPHYVRARIAQVEYNMLMPKRLINNLLQAEFAGAGITFTRFLINSTVGVGGFWDPAKGFFQLEKQDEDTGQTFAVWGIPPGCHLYIPVVAGNTTLRDGVGLIFDEAMDPRTYAPFGSFAKAFMKFNNMTLKIDKLEKLRAEYYDPYALSRDMWYIMRTQDIAE